MLTGKVALVTGGSRGIGRAIALRMAEYHAEVVITYCSSLEKAQEVKENMDRYGRNNTILHLDVCDEGSVTQVFKEINQIYGKLDILVNNAGEGVPVSFEEITVEDWDRTIDLNLRGTFMCIRYAIPLLKKSGAGRIINLSSVAGLTGGAFGPGYAASKAGIIGLTKSAARELGGYGISVNAVAPGPIDSEMTARLDAGVMSQIINATPQKRLGKLEEVAEIACQLANPRIGYITGQTVVVDGGRYMI